MKYNIICMDPSWSFDDELKQSKTKRGASSNYPVLDNNEIASLNIKDVAEKDAVIAIWVPSSLLDYGFKCLDNYGFDLKQTWIWVKLKQDPLEKLKKSVGSLLKNNASNKDVIDEIDKFDLNESLNFFMGRTFRQTHEVCLIGTRGKCGKFVKNKSQRSVHLFSSLKKHSQKPEELQDRLEKIFPSFTKKLEVFARRSRQDWICLGNESPLTLEEDVRDSLKKLNKIKDISGNIITLDDNSIVQSWNEIEI